MALVALFVVLGEVALEPPSVSADEDKVVICHRTNAATNPYEQIEVDASAADGSGENDHSQHTGPVATTVSVAEDLKDAQIMWGDIIPPHHDFPGLNWNSNGIAVYENDCNPLPEEDGSLIVAKLCEPEDVDGSFTILVDGETVATLDCGESTDPIDLEPGMHTVSEQGAGEFESEFSGGCDSTGDVDIDSGRTVTCTITNTFEEEAGLLTITKICDPVGDPGEFLILLDGVSQGQRGCGESVFNLELEPGTYTVTEAAGPGTDLDDYTSSFGGDCDSTGDVDVIAGEEATCTITNVREEGPQPEDGSLTVTKLCDPTDDDGTFTILVEGNVISTNLDCGESTPVIDLAPGTYTVSEQFGPGTNAADYNAFFGGDCAPNGDVIISEGEDASCTLTNVRVEAPPAIVAPVIPPTTVTEVIIVQQNLPPAAPVEVQSVTEEPTQAPAASAASVTALPNTGSGGHEASGSQLAWLGGAVLVAGLGGLGLAVRCRAHN